MSSKFTQSAFIFVMNSPSSSFSSELVSISLNKPLKVMSCYSIQFLSLFLMVPIMLKYSSVTDIRIFIESLTHGFNCGIVTLCRHRLIQVRKRIASAWIEWSICIVSANNCVLSSNVRIVLKDKVSIQEHVVSLDNRKYLKDLVQLKCFPCCSIQKSCFKSVYVKFTIAIKIKLEHFLIEHISSV